MNTQLEELALADKYFEEDINTGEGQARYTNFYQAYLIYAKYRNWEKVLECIFQIEHCYEFAVVKEIISNVLKVADEELTQSQKCILLLHLGAACIQISEVEEALVHSKLSLSIAKELGNLAHIVSCYRVLGDIYSRTQKVHYALQYHFKALHIAQKYNFKKDVFKSYYSIALSYYHAEQFYLSKNYFKLVLHLGTQIENLPASALTVSKGILGVVCIDLGHYQEAETYLEEALKECQMDSQDDVDVCAHLGFLHAYHHRWVKAEKSFQAALTLQEKLTPDNAPFSIILYSIFIEAYVTAEKWDKAIEYLDKSKEKMLAAEGLSPYYLASVYQSYGIVFERRASFEVALNYIHQAEAYIKKAVDENEIEVKQVRLQISMLQIKIYLSLFKAKGDITLLKKAVALFPLLDEIIQAIRSRLFTEGDGLELNQQISTHYRTRVEIWDELFVSTKQKIAVANAFLACEKNKVHGLLSNIKNVESLQFSDISVDKLTALQSIQQQIVNAEKKVKVTLKKDHVPLIDHAAQALVKLQVEYHQFIKQLEAEYSDYHQAKKQLPSVSVKEIQQLLHPQTALIEYEITQEHLYIFCLSSTDIQVKRQPLPTDFDRQLNYLIDDGILGLNRKKYVETAYQMYQCLVEPILPFLQYYNIRHLHIIPGNQLLELPFEALLTMPISYKSSYGAFPYLIRDYSIQYHYSATLWAYQQKRVKKIPQHESEFMGFAPVYSYGQIEDLPTMVEATRAVSIEGVNYQALLYSEKEVQDIQASFVAIGKSSQIHLRTDANLQHFKKSLQESSAKYLHIAAHSVLSEEEEELVGILFSPIQVATSATTETNIAFVKRTASETDFDTSDMVLYPSEVAQLSLENDLVFLSCCKSGVGKLVEGEGMLSINRSFLSAGVSNIVFTLFKIYDSKTPILTQHFYEAILLQGKSYSEALQYAKLQMIQLGIAPKFWSGFLLLGE